MMSATIRGYYFLKQARVSPAGSFAKMLHITHDQPRLVPRLTFVLRPDWPGEKVAFFGGDRWRQPEPMQWLNPCRGPKPNENSKKLWHVINDHHALVNQLRHHCQTAFNHICAKYQQLPPLIKGRNGGVALNFQHLRRAFCTRRFHPIH